VGNRLKIILPITKIEKPHILRIEHSDWDGFFLTLYADTHVPGFRPPSEEFDIKYKELI